MSVAPGSGLHHAREPAKGWWEDGIAAQLLRYAVDTLLTSDVIVVWFFFDLSKCELGIDCKTRSFGTYIGRIIPF